MVDSGLLALATRAKNYGVYLELDEMGALLASVFAASTATTNGEASSGNVAVADWCKCGKPYSCGFPLCDQRLHGVVDRINSASALIKFVKMDLVDKCTEAKHHNWRASANTICVMLAWKMALLAQKASKLELPDWLTEDEGVPWRKEDMPVNDVLIFVADVFEAWLARQSIKSYRNRLLVVELSSFSGGFIEHHQERVEAIVAEILAADLVIPRVCWLSPEDMDDRNVHKMALIERLEKIKTYADLQELCGMDVGFDSDAGMQLLAGREHDDIIVAYLELRLASTRIMDVSEIVPANQDHVEYYVQSVLTSIVHHCAREADRPRRKRGSKGTGSGSSKFKKPRAV